jgi:hypothetical protein
MRSGIIVLLLLLFPSMLAAGHVEDQYEVADEEEKACFDLYYNLMHHVGSHNYCETNDDCMAPYIGCPLGCATPLNKDTSLTYVGDLVKLYENQCKPCKYKCIDEPRLLRCVKGRCKVDFLEEVIRKNKPKRKNP